MNIILDSSLQPPLLTLNTHRILTLASGKEPAILKVAATLLNAKSIGCSLQDRGSKPRGMHTLQQKQPSCHSLPRAFTTISVIGLLHPAHFPLNRLQWQPTHHAYPSFSTNGVLASKGSPHSAQKKCPTCHSPPQATTTSPSIGVLQDLHRGLNFSWKSR